MFSFVCWPALSWRRLSRHLSWRHMCSFVCWPKLVWWHSMWHLHVTLHFKSYITLHDIAWNDITLRSVTLCCVSLRYMTWCCVVILFATCTWHHITLHHITSRDITLHYITLHFITLHWTMPSYLFLQAVPGARLHRAAAQLHRAVAQGGRTRRAAGLGGTRPAPRGSAAVSQREPTAARWHMWRNV